MKRIVFALAMSGVLGSYAMEQADNPTPEEQQQQQQQQKSPKGGRKKKAPKEAFKIPAGYILIPNTMPRPNALFPDGKIHGRNLYLNSNTKDAFTQTTFKEALENKRPFEVLAVVTTKVDGQYVYNVFDALSLNNYLFGPTYEKTLKNTLVDSFKHPVNGQIIVGEIDYYTWDGLDEPLEFIGTSYDVAFNSPALQKEVRLIIKAGSGNLGALNALAAFYLQVMKSYDKVIDLGKKILILTNGESGFLFIAKAYRDSGREKEAEPFVIQGIHFYLKNNTPALAEGMAHTFSSQESRRLYMRSLVAKALGKDQQAQGLLGLARKAGLTDDERVAIDEAFGKNK